jgi:hypothetical protein
MLFSGASATITAPTGWTSDSNYSDGFGCDNIISNKSFSAPGMALNSAIATASSTNWNAFGIELLYLNIQPRRKHYFLYKGTSVGRYYYDMGMGNNV